MLDGRPRYVYDLSTVMRQARLLKQTLPAVDGLYYAMKANAHRGILQTVVSAGFGIECVSAAEVLRARKIGGAGVRVMFTPNFCPLEEYATALGAGAEIVVDGPGPLQLRPSIFEGRRIGIRVDPGRGFGHHEKVRTAGAHAKFGQAISDLQIVRSAAERCGAQIVGLQAHVGSGIRDPRVWSVTGRVLATLVRMFDDLEWISLGGGLAVAERDGDTGLDLHAVENGLAPLRDELGPITLRMEPGRFLVSEAGALLAPVTQVRRKGGVSYVGVSVGMNSLLRPALYGAWHGIHNLTRLGEAATGPWTVVGPICESADVLGRDRFLPATRPGDVMLVENAGAYGAVMASSYNLRPPPRQHVLPLGHSPDP